MRTQFCQCHVGFVMAINDGDCMKQLFFYKLYPNQAIHKQHTQYMQTSYKI